MGVSKSFFGNLSTGEAVNLYHMENASGAYADVMDYGAILVRLGVPDKNGEIKDIVLGYDDLKEYEVNSCFFGSTIGPNGNRIAGAKFTIDGTVYSLAANENDNNLHSGPNGFEKKLWTGEVLDGKNAVCFSRISPDGENGFPGEFKVCVTYELSEDNELILTYEGVSDKATVANLTNHTYFNLEGEGSGEVLDQLIMIHAQAFSAIPDSAAIPTGENRPVEGTPLDLRQPKKIGLEINSDYDQLVFTGGYDHNFICDSYEKGVVREIASACSEKTGIAMTVLTDLPCVQFYAGNFIKQENGKNGHIYKKRHGFCLETQVEPNAVNEPSFHSPVIAAGEKYFTRTIYRFTVI